MRLERALPSAAAVAIVLAVAGCRGPAPAGHPPGTVRAAIPTDPQTLSLLGKNDRYSQVIGQLVSDSLVRYDESLELVPRLAASWDVSDGGRTVEFHLRPGVRWQDGAPVTSRDVLFSVEKARDPAVEAHTYRAQFADLEAIDAPDDLTVRARYREGFADFLEAWTLPILPEHLAGRDADLLTGAFAQAPVGCGPFRLVRYDPGRGIVLEAWDGYWDGPPRLRKLVFKVIKDERTQYQELLGGGLDLLGVTPDLWEEHRGDPSRGKDIAAFTYHRLSLTLVAWNEVGNPFFADPRVRIAMMHALDRETFIRSVAHGLATPAATTFLAGSPWTDPSIRPWAYDPAEAGRLLDDAGWIDRDGDGVRDRDGRPFRFTLLVPQGSQEITDRIAQWMQQSLASLGVAVELEKLEWRTYLERRNAGRFEAAMAFMSFTPIPDCYELYHSSQRDGGYDFFGLDDPEVDRLVERGRRTFDRAARVEVYHRLQARLHALEPLGCLFQFTVPVLVRRGLEGVRPTAIDYWRVVPGPRAWHWSDDPGG